MGRRNMLKTPSASKLDATMNPTEAAHVLGISRQAVHSLLRSGTLPGRKVYGSWRIKVREVHRYQQIRETRKG